MTTDNLGERALGRKLATYGGSRSFAFGGWFIAVLLAGVGGFLFWLAAQARSGAMKFTGDLQLLYKAGGACIGVAVVVVVLFAVLKRRGTKIDVHEDGLHAIGPRSAQLDLYRDIQDVYLAPTGLFGYRTDPSSPWLILDNRVSKMAELRRRLVEGQVAHRLGWLRSQIAQGGTATFRYFSVSDNQHQAMWNPRKVDIPTYELVIDAQMLSLDGKAIPLSRLSRVASSQWRDKVTFTDVDGTTFYSMPATSVLSLDLLRALIEALQRA